MIHQVLLPGFGRPLNYIPRECEDDYTGKLLRNALSDRDMQDELAAQPLMTLRELAMLQFMSSVTDKNDWEKKVYNDEIAQKWTEEVCNDPDRKFSQKMGDRCIDELRYVASLRAVSSANLPPIFVFNGDVVKSDTAISSELKQRLQEAVLEFEDSIPDRYKDWHPGSDGKVLDLVHPSLYPLVYGRTRVLADGVTTTLEDCIRLCGKGEIVPIPPQKEKVELASRSRVKIYGRPYPLSPQLLGEVFSTKFQWLPCEVDISGEGAKITSYINNLHPTKEKDIYELVEEIIEACIPLWNATLAPLADQNFERQSRITYTSVDYDPDPASLSESEWPPQEPDEDEDDYNERIDEWIRETQRVVFPEPDGEEFEPLSQPEPFDLKSTYGDRGLQVIVKFANIYLTPETPEYEGGTWHVEGQMNEHIVATAIYYYSTDNITTSTLSFRQQCQTAGLEAKIGYRQNDHEWLLPIFGCEDDAVQTLGSVVTREGRLLTFPNILQHRVDPFKLEDRTRPGHRKIVALFLVDPNIKIMSTAHVPCQQQDWWWEAVMAPAPLRLAACTPHMDTGQAVSKVPIELRDSILKNVDFPISMSEAKALRLELMEERKMFMVKHGESFEKTISFSLCEH